MDSSRFLPDLPKSTTESVGELVLKIAAGAAGVGATTLTGNPLAGVGTGVGVDKGGQGLLGFFLHRGDSLAALTMNHAAGRFEERKMAGEKPRSDGFKGKSAIEAVAATIKAAANSVEERKARLIGSLLASSEFEDDFPIDDLLRFLGLLEALPWRQALALSYFADESRQSARTLIAAGGGEGGRQIRPVLEAEIAELAEVHGLIGVVVVGDDDGVAKPNAVYGGTPIVAANLDKVSLTGFGLTLYRLSEMEMEITAKDLDDFVSSEIL